MLNFGDGDILLPDTDGSIDAPDRAHLLGLYSGLTLSGEALLNLRILLGSVVLLASGDVAPPSSGSDVPWEIEGLFVVRSVGASGTIMATARYDNGQTSGLLANAAAIVVDTTTAADLQVSAQWGTASASNSIKVQNLFVEKYTP